MTGILHTRVTEVSGIKRYKAPRGFMYEIFTMYGAIDTANGNSVAILDYLVEDEVSFISNLSHLIGLIDTLVAGNHFNFTLLAPIKTKFISISASFTSPSFIVNLFINYKLVKASRTELLLEWFRKGR